MGKGLQRDEGDGEKRDWRQIFHENVNYKDLLKSMKHEFKERYIDQQPSPYGGLEDFDELAVVGSGAFGMVKLCQHKFSKQYSAIKIISKEHVVKTKQITHIISEKKILFAVSFPNLISLLFSRKDNDYLYLGMPFIRGGELFSYHRRKRKFPEEQTKFYGAQIFLAFEYLHNLNILYRDLKPENVLIDHKGYLVLTDFGFCKIVETRTWTLCGTPEYLAPEIIQSQGYGKSVDWWTFGVFLYELVVGKSPFYQAKGGDMKMYSKIVKGSYTIPAGISKELTNLIHGLLQVDRTKRYGCMKNGSDEIKYHVFFSDINWISILRSDVPAPYVPDVSETIDTSNFDKHKNISLQRSKSEKFPDVFAEF